MDNIRAKGKPSPFACGDSPSGVSSYGAGVGEAAATPNFLEGPTKSQTFLSVLTVDLLWSKLKSYADLVSAPPLLRLWMGWGGFGYGWDS